MFLKSDVTVKYLKPEILLAILIIRDVYTDFNEKLTITSVTDGTHNPNSKHSGGYAVDLRTRYLSSDTMIHIATELRTRLTQDYDIIIERDHLHVEYDPK